MQYILSIIFQLLFLAPVGLGQQLQVAVASNFYEPLSKLAEVYNTQHRGNVKLSPGSTGKLFSQITMGAPFDLFFAADKKHPQMLINSQHAVAKSFWVYGHGRLVLWKKDSRFRLSAASISQQGLRFAIANPKLAPYGQAAQEYLTKVHLWTKIKPFLIYGSNIGHTFQYAYTDPKTLAFTALSQMIARDIPSHHYDVISEEFHTPVEQASVILTKSRYATEAIRFMTFMQGKGALSILASYGYRDPIGRL